MASSAKHFSFLLFLLFLFNCYCPQIQARESQFFSKFTLHHNNLNTNSSSSNNNNNITTSGTITNTTTPSTTSKKETKEVLPREEAPLPKLNEERTTSFTPENQNGHGLYGDQGSTQFPPSTMTTTTSLAEAPTDDYVDATYEEDNNNNNNPYTFTEGPSGTPTNEYTGATYEENNNNNNNNNWSEMMKKQGMSDTRFMENGRYFYNVNTNTNLYHNSEYRSPSLNRNNYNNGFGSSSRGGRGEMDNYNNAADNTFDDDEFNNYMDQDQPTTNNNDQYVP